MKGKTLADFDTAVADTPDPAKIRYNVSVPAGTKRFIITSAQNATPVHPHWWRVLQNMARDKKAQLLVVPLRYKNPTSVFAGEGDYWAPELVKHLCDERKMLHKNLILLADIKTQPTASSPLTGIDAVSSAASCIVGHTKLQLKCVATPSSSMAKILTTTGACTQANYTDTKAGKVGEFHHSLSAVLVELDGKYFHIRQLHFDDKSKSCTDMPALKQYFVDRIGVAPRPEALVTGDTHVDAICPEVERATYGKGGMIDTCKPKHIVFHDLLDAYSCNPHHWGNPFNMVAKRKHGADNVRAEVERAIEFVRKRVPQDCVGIIVDSNHDDMLSRWIAKNDWRLDPTNAEFYLETALAMARGTTYSGSGTSYPSAFAYWFDRARVARALLLKGDQSYMLKGVDLGQHGHKGPNGARGSIKNLRRIGVKTITGHPHSPGIDEGCTQVGTSTWLRLEYNGGPSSWMNAHCWLNHDGKRQLNFIIKGRWRA